MIKADELLDILEEIKQQIQENHEQDGSCRFDAYRINVLLHVTESTLRDSIADYSEKA